MPTRATDAGSPFPNDSDTGRMQRLATIAHDAVVEIDPDARISFWNAAAERLFGYGAAEALGRDLHQLIASPEDRAAFQESFSRFRNTGTGPVIDTVTEVQAVRRDGSTFFAELSIAALSHGGTWGALGIVRDVTERKRAEDELRESFDALRRVDDERRRLLARLATSHDEERASTAVEIAEGPLELVGALRLRLGASRQRHADPATLADIAHMEEATALAIGALRRIIMELRPPELEREGIAAAIRAYLDHVVAETGIGYELADRLSEEPPAHAQLAIYHIAIEALSNVLLHSGAGQVSVLMESREEGTSIRIEDDGRGFDPREVAEHGHTGLASMQERAELAGGRCAVESSPGAGTQVELWIPNEPEEAPVPSSRSGEAGRPPA